MYTEEVWIGSNSVSPLVCWATHVFWFISRLDVHPRWTKRSAFIAIPPHEGDGFRAPSLFSSTSVCIQMRSGLVWQRRSFRLGYTYVLVHLALGRCIAGRNGKAQMYYLMNKMDRGLPSCLRVLRHVYKRGLDWFQQYTRSASNRTEMDAQCCQSLESYAITLLTRGNAFEMDIRILSFVPDFEQPILTVFHHLEYRVLANTAMCNEIDFWCCQSLE
jgi:hypothetical protein